jgi:thymidylate kinase
VLEGFPNNDTDLQLLHEHGLFLDLILILNTDTENCLRRLQKAGKLEKLVKRRPDEDMTPDYNARIERSMPRANEMQNSSKAPVAIVDGNRCQRMVLADVRRILGPYLQQVSG